MLAARSSSPWTRAASFFQFKAVRRARLLGPLQSKRPWREIVGVPVEDLNRFIAGANSQVRRRALVAFHEICAAGWSPRTER